MLRLPLHPLLLCFASFLAACGGTASSASGGAGGSGGSGGSGASGGSAGGSGGSSGGSGGGQPADCPAEEPESNTPCDLDPAETCAYGDMCCPNLYGCFNGLWSQYDVDCAAPAACPSEPPAAGSACGGTCLQVSPCGYACNQGSSILAECAGETWMTTESPCMDEVMCGEVTCLAGQICVENGGGAGISYSCTDNPCAPEPLSCECAGSICGGDPYECHVYSGNQMSCVCPICP